MVVKDCFSDVVFEGKNPKLQSCVFCVGWIFGVIWVLLFSFLRTTPGYQTVWKKKDELRCFWGTRLRSTFRKKQSHNHNQGGCVAKMVCGRFLVCCCVKETILKPKNGLKKAKKTAFCLESILAFFLVVFEFQKLFSELSELLTKWKQNQLWQQEKLIAEFLGDLP